MLHFRYDEHRPSLHVEGLIVELMYQIAFCEALYNKCDITEKLVFYLTKILYKKLSVIEYTRVNNTVLPVQWILI
jgi:hypothetical protein